MHGCAYKVVCHRGGWRSPHPLIVVLAAVILAWMLSGCGPSWSPVEKRETQTRDYLLNEDGNYRVRRGDSLYVIAFNFGLDWRDLAEWNGIRAPYVIYPDQELRMSPPDIPDRDVVEIRPAQTPQGSTSRDGGAGTPAPAPDWPAKTGSTVATRPVESPPAGAPAGTEPARRPAPDAWLWPTDGRVISTFRPNDPARNGIDIGGREGQPVIATAAGEVVYSGSGLIGYGELIIIKHTDRLLSAYAHNRRRLVAEGQAVAAGEMVAEMGRNDRNQPLLHFEIRVNGTPQDPMRYLPKR